MNKWESAARTAATRKFCELLDQDAALRQQCKDDKSKAWETLRAAGDFEDMPADVEVHVFENEVKSSDKVVTMVLPEKGQLPPVDVFDAKGVWLCSWTRYLQ